MKNKKSRIMICLTLICIIISVFLIGCENKKSISADNEKTSEKKIVTDVEGRKVEIPSKVNKVASLMGSSYEKVMLLGQENKIALNNEVKSKWAVKVCPALSKIPTTSSAHDPNLEDLITKKIDVVFFWNTPKPIAKMTKSKIPVVVVTSEKNNTSLEAFKKYAKNEIKLYGQVLGGNAPEIANEWCQYFDKKVEYVTSKTSSIPEDKRPKVYYVRGNNALTTDGCNSYTQWYIEMAGGTLVTKNSIKNGSNTNVGMEDVLKWNPDVIFVGRVDNTNLITNDPKWSNITAVKDKKVYLNPEGVYPWDDDSEEVLLMEYYAKALHPDLFKDLDMKKEVKEYYSKFYKYNLTDDEANRILQHLPPAN